MAGLDHFHAKIRKMFKHAMSCCNQEEENEEWRPVISNPYGFRKENLSITGLSLDQQALLRTHMVKDSHHVFSTVTPIPQSSSLARFETQTRPDCPPQYQSQSPSTHGQFQPHSRHPHSSHATCAHHHHAKTSSSSSPSSRTNTCTAACFDGANEPTLFASPVAAAAAAAAAAEAAVPRSKVSMPKIGNFSLPRLPAVTPGSVSQMTGGYFMGPAASASAPASAYQLPQGTIAGKSGVEKSGGAESRGTEMHSCGERGTSDEVVSGVAKPQHQRKNSHGYSFSHTDKHNHGHCYGNNSGHGHQHPGYNALPSQTQNHVAAAKALEDGKAETESTHPPPTAGPLAMSRYSGFVVDFGSFGVSASSSKPSSSNSVVTDTLLNAQKGQSASAGEMAGAGFSTAQRRGEGVDVDASWAGHDDDEREAFVSGSNGEAETVSAKGDADSGKGMRVGTVP